MKVRRSLGRRAPHAQRLLSLLLGLLVAGSAVPFAPAARAARQDGAASAPRASKAAGEAEFVPGAALVRFRSEWEADAASVSLTEVEVGRDAGEFGPGRIISPELGGDGRAGQIVRARFQRFDGSDLVPGLRLTELSTADRAQTLAAISALNRRPDVLYAEPNYVWRAKAVPNDPSFGQQYAMQNISAPAAWDTTTGSKSVVVAVIDTGVNLQHSDLVDNAWVNPGETPGNGVDDDQNGFTDDVNGWDFAHDDNTIFDNASDDDHGTHVAGIVGARGHNSTGVAGVNWQVSIMALKVLSPGGGATSDIIASRGSCGTSRRR